MYIRLINSSNYNNSEDIMYQLRQYMSTHIEDLIDYAEEDGYEAELLSNEFMLISKDNYQYKAHIDKAGDTYYIDDIQEL